MKTSNSTTALHTAVQAGDTEQVKALIAQGIELNNTDKQSNTALKLASQGSGRWGSDHTTEKLEIVKLLIAAGADLNIPDEDGNTPLHVAISWSNHKDFENIAFALIEAKVGADIHKADNRGRTPLFFASYSNEIIAIDLIARGAGVHVKDKDKDKDNPDDSMLCYALHKEFKRLFYALLEEGVTTAELDNFVQKKTHSGESILSDKAWQIYHQFQLQQKEPCLTELIENIKQHPDLSETWNKVCALYSFHLQKGRFDQALHFEQNLTANQIALGYAHNEFVIFRITLYLKLGNQQQLQQIIRESFTYSRLYQIGEPWRERWSYLSDTEFETLQEIEQQRAIMHKKYPCDAYASYKEYPVEKRPFIWFEEATLKKAKQKCAISGKKLEKGTLVYKFKSLNKHGWFEADFFYADIEAFKGNPVAMNNKACYENNSYKIEDFAFYWQKTDWHPWCRRFWYKVDTFSLQQTLQLLGSPLIPPAGFKHRYGRFLDNGNLIQRQHEQLYHTEYLLSSGCGREYLNIWHALIKCGYLDDIIEALPTLPAHVPYLLLCFDIPEVKQKTVRYLQIDGIAEVMDITLKSYAHKSEKDLKHLIEFSLNNPKAIEGIAELLNTYQLHLYNVYYPAIDWYCQAFSRFSTAKGAGLLDLLIPYPQLLHPLTLLLKNGGELTGASYSDTEIFFIRTVFIYTSLFNPTDMERLYNSLNSEIFRQSYDKLWGF